MSENARWGLGGLAAGVAALALGPYIGFWASEVLLLLAGAMFFVLASKFGGYGKGAARKRHWLRAGACVLILGLLAIPAVNEWQKGREAKSLPVVPQIAPPASAAAPVPLPAPPAIEPRELRDAAKEGARQGAKEGARELIEKQAEEGGNPQGDANIIAQGKRPPPVAHVRYTSSPVVSKNDAAPYGLRVVVQTDVPITDVSFRLVFTGPIRFADFRYITAERLGVEMSNLQSPFKEIQGNTFKFGFSAPAFVPERPIIVTVFSTGEVAVKGLDLETP